MSIKGFNINGSIERYDYRSLDNLPSVDRGLSEQAKQALLNCFRNVAWSNESGQEYYDALETALGREIIHSVTNVLSGCSTSNPTSTVEDGSAYYATITASEGHSLVGATVSITMGGSSVIGYYQNGTISIPSVTGDVIISVTASAEVLSISAAFSQGTATVYDTDSLDTLRQYLVVTANYSDGSSATVTDYTLSGTLTEGTSTITVNCGNKVTTFNVEVEHNTVIVYHPDTVQNEYVTIKGAIEPYSGWNRTGYVDVQCASEISFPPLNSKTSERQFNCFFDADRNFIEYFTLNQSTNLLKSLPFGTKYFILSGASSAFNQMIQNDIIGSRNAIQEGWTNGVPYSLEKVEGWYYSLLYSQKGFVAENGWSRTKFVDCHGATSVTFPAFSASDNNYNAWFDENRKAIGTFSLSSAEKTISVPSGAYYFVCSGVDADVDKLLTSIVPNG